MDEKPEWAPETPALTVDAIVEVGDDRRIVLIERKHPPHGWALPGGFVDRGETLIDAARRETREETGLDVEILELFHAYSDPSRDHRLHTVSVVFLARADARALPHGGDDATRAQLFRREELPSPIVFDHGRILADYFCYRDEARRPPPER
jgi:ADP-ribose pyrophosphatase YjhB (NUDIX family)